MHERTKLFWLNIYPNGKELSSAEGKMQNHDYRIKGLQDEND